MRDEQMATLLRVTRIRLGLRQADVARRCAMTRDAVSRHERGEIGRASLDALRRHASALALRGEFELRGSSGAMPLADDEHAAVADHTKRWLERCGWEVVPEATYSEYGERGRIDLLGRHLTTGTILIVEVKTLVADAQQLLGSLDTKERLALAIARQRGWPTAGPVATLLAVTRTDLNVGRIERLGALFAGFAVRGTAARQWIEAPAGTARLLLWQRPEAVGRAAWRVGRQRVRVPSAGHRG